MWRPMVRDGLAGLVASLTAMGLGLTLAAAVSSASAQTLAASQTDPATGRVAYLVAPFVDHYRDVTVWSEQLGTPTGVVSDQFALTASIGGTRVRLPVAQRAGDPFDVDLGPGADGHVVAVYSRCATPTKKSGRFLLASPDPQWATAGGCDVYRFDFSTMREQKVTAASSAGASEMLPTIWKNTIAFVRVYERRPGRRSVYPYLYVRSLAGGRTRVQAGGPRGVFGLPGPTSLELYGRWLAYTWGYAVKKPDFEPAPASQVRLDDTRTGRTRVLDHAARGAFLTPSGSQGGIDYGYQRVTGTSTGAIFSASRRHLRYDIAARRRTSVPIAPQGLLVSLARDGDSTAYGLGASTWGAGIGSTVVLGS